MCNVNHGPGKFETETCITVWAYDMMLNGFQDDTEYDENENPLDIFNGPFNEAELIAWIDAGFGLTLGGDTVGLCLECLEDMKTVAQVKFWQDSYGFAYSYNQGSAPYTIKVS